MDADSIRKDTRTQSEKFEYDAAIGGYFPMENELNTFLHCHQHINEIKSLTSAIETPNSTKLIFQKLPKHMRRRAMSHNPNRLPRKHRLAHRAQMSKSGQPVKAKRPSRKFRRRPQNLLSEYKRRQKENKWLETHVWHAKRFRMVRRWGFRLAKSSCDKTFRSSYRAMVKHCLIQDISYYSCIEIHGPMIVLKGGFDQLQSRETGLSIFAKALTNGLREGSVELYAANSYPYKSFGRVQFIWKSSKKFDEFPRLWIFIHPSICDHIIDELKKVFELENVNCEMKSTKKLSNVTTSVTLYEIKHHLNRFRLTGPLSHSILSSAFKSKQKMDSGEKSWFADWIGISSNRRIHENQSNYWNNLKNLKAASELPPSTIIALNIEDPRINRPKKRSKAIPSNVAMYSDDLDVLTTIPYFSADSAIWDWKLRERIQQEKVSTHEICVQRNKNILVPGERCAFENGLQPIPVLLLQRPGSKSSKRTGFGGGYDVIIPAGYGISTWMCLIMWGAKPGGLRESDTIAREGLEDEYLPDTRMSMMNSRMIESELRERYFRKPINKRLNYLKLSIASPFNCMWQQLIDESRTETNNGEFYVLRNQNKLNHIKQLLAGKYNRPVDIDENALIPISFVINSRGIANNFSIICLPKKKDFQRNSKHIQRFDNRPAWSEPNGRDENETIRKALRQNHLKVLKRLRRRRVRDKRQKQEYSHKNVLIVPPRTAEIISKQFKEISELCLPSQPRTIRFQCSREVIGYVTQSQFSLSEAKVSGIGYITANGFMKLCELKVKNKSNQVLIRDPSSINYRFATISIRCF